MKRIFVSCFHPATLRDILSIIESKKFHQWKEAQAILFVLDYKKQYFEEQIKDSRVIIEGVNLDSPSKKLMTLIMKRIARLSLDTYTARIEKRAKWKREGKFFYYLFSTLLGKCMSRSRFLRDCMRMLDYYFTATDRYLPYFLKYRPEGVLVTDVQNERDVELMQNARKNSVSVFGLVRNWDNLSSHGILRLLPDILFVPSKKVKQHAMILNDMPESKIKLVGVAHYDRYTQTPAMQREEFCKMEGLDPRGKFILFAPIGDTYLPDNSTDAYILSLLGSLSVKVLVRFSPTVPVKKLEGISPCPNNMVLHYPGMNFKKGVLADQELTPQDDEQLFYSLYYSDIVVCGPSTIALDAVFFDKPVVLVNFHPSPKKYWERIIKYECDHFRDALRTGGVSMAKSKEEFLELLDQYIHNPLLDTEKREVLRDFYCGPRDGQAGERIADVILGMLKTNKMNR